MSRLINQVKLNKDVNSTFLDTNRYYHNDISINDWLASSSVDASVKIALRLAYFYLSDKNAALKPEERIYIQNTALSTYRNLDNPEQIYYSINKRNTVKALDRLFEMGIIKHFMYEDSDGNHYKWQNGSIAEWQKDFAGLTKRYIVLDINRLKELFTITNKDKTYLEAKDRSSLRRFVMRRPFTLVDLVKELRTKQVEDINAAKKVINLYLVEQYKRFGDFSAVENESTEESTASEATLSAIYRYIYPDGDYVKHMSANNN